MKHHKLGHYSFMIGVLLVILAGILLEQPSPLVTLIIVIVGLIVGYLNWHHESTNDFLIPAIALLVASSAQASQIGQLAPSMAWIGPAMAGIFINIKLFVAPATIIVALKAVKRVAEVG